jgi:hypothetical protein
VRIVKARWDAYTDMQKEVLMFHEIGHALLGRVHTNERLPDCSSFKSIMNENSLTVYTNSSIERREYYVDELLDAFAEYPSWAPLPPTKVEIDLDPSTFTFVQTQQAAHTGNVEDDGSLHIGVGGLSGDGTSSWNIPIPTDNIPIEGTFELKVKIKTQMIPRGTGASVSINSDLIGTVTYNASTAYYGFSPIAATTTDFVPLTLKLNCYQISKPKMFVSLTMDGQSIGDAWFTDIELNYYHN